MPDNSTPPQALRDAVTSGDAAAARRHSGLAGGAPVPVGAVLRGLSLAGAAQEGDGAARGLLFADAVRDLIPTFAGDEPAPLLEGAVETMLRWSYAPSRPETLLLAEGDRVEVVAVSELEDALAEGDFEASLRVGSRLLSVIRSKESFLENLLEMASQQEDREIVSWTTAAVKALHDSSGEPLREIVYHLLRRLSRCGMRLRRRPPAAVAPTSWGGLFLRATEDDDPSAANARFVAYAFQAIRYAEVKRSRVAAGLRRSFDAFWPQWESAPVPAGEDVPAPTGENLTSMDPADGRALRDLIVEGDARRALEILRRWWGRVEDPDPLYRWIAEACLMKGTRGDPDPLVALNASRWGAHLAKPAGWPVVRRAVEAVARLPGPGGGGA